MSASLAALLILQWVVLLVLATVVLALIRQVGLLHQRIAPAGALMISEGVRVGQVVPAITLKTLDGDEIVLGSGSPQGLSTLFMFVAPDCPVCAQLIPALTSIARQESSWLRVIFASDGKTSDHATFRLEKGLDALPYVISREIGLAFQVAKLPYGVLLDENDVLVAQGLTNNREHVESLFEARRLKSATLQEFLARGESAPAGETLSS
jgi:methylamine dehydrogenase accessory protein MauD